MSYSFFEACWCESLDEIARGDDFDASLFDELDGPRVNTRDIRNGTQWRVLHRDSVHPRQEAAKARLELVASGVPRGLSRQMHKRMGLDRMDETSRLARGRYEVKPAPGSEVAALMRYRGDVGGNGIEPPKVVQEPAVDTIIGQRLLDRRHVE